MEAKPFETSVLGLKGNRRQQGFTFDLLQKPTLGKSVWPGLVACCIGWGLGGTLLGLLLELLIAKVSGV